MLSAEEKRRLVSRFQGEPIFALAAVLKCVAGLLILVIVAAGPWTFPTAGGGAPSADAERVSPPVDPAVTESKRVFEERREVYESARQNYSAVPKDSVRNWWLSFY